MNEVRITQVTKRIGEGSQELQIKQFRAECSGVVAFGDSMAEMISNFDEMWAKA